MAPIPNEFLRKLKERRQSTPPDAPFIGEYGREARRIGRPVTQEEIAEALGISREWYCALENGKCTDVSPELIMKIVCAFYDRRAARRVLRQLDDGPAATLGELRSYVKRIRSASTYFDAAVEAIETGCKLLSVTCVAVINLEGKGGEIPGHAIGPQARFWKPLCDRMVRDAHRALRRGGVGVNEYVPTADEVSADPSVVLSFDSPEPDCDYEYVCSSDLWHDFNGDLGVRSVIAVPLHDRDGYRGTASFSWSAPRNIESREIELARNLIAVLELL
jgi:transcriptional regulator with XRE-family HTH domain